MEDVSEAKLYLSSTSSKWILVLDDVNPSLKIHDYLPKTPKGCLIVMTSTNTKLKDLAGAGTLEIGPMDEGEALELLLRTARKEQIEEPERDAANALIQDLGKFALAIDLAGANIKESKCSIHEYRNAFRMKKLFNRNPESIVTGYTKSIFDAWSLSYEAVSKAQTDYNGKYAIEILHFISLLHSQQVPIQILLEAWRNKSQAGNSNMERTLKAIDLVEQEETEFDFWDSLMSAINLLNSYALVTYVDEGPELKPKTLSMQPIVHRWARDQLSKSSMRKIWHKSVSTMAAAVRSADTSKALQRDMVPHLDQLIEPHSSELFSMPCGAMMCFEYTFTFADIYSETGFHRKATTLLRFLCTKTQECLPDEIPRYAQALRQLGRSYSDLGEYTEAFKCRAKAVNQLEPQLNADSVLLLSCKGDLSDSLHDMDKYADAFEMRQDVYRRLHSFQIQNKYVSEFCRASRRLANSYKHRGEKNKASEILCESIDLQKRHSKNKEGIHELLISKTELAQSYESDAEVWKALATYNDVLAMREADSHNIHDILAAKEDVANVRSILQEHPEALRLRQEIMDAWDDLCEELGHEHPHFLVAMSNLGKSLADNGDYKQSLVEHEKVLKIRQRRLGENYPATLTTMLEKGRVLILKGELTHAIATYQNVINSCENSVEERDSNARNQQRMSPSELRQIAAQAKGGLATAIQRQGKSDEALLQREELFQDQEKADPGLCMELTLQIMYDLASNYEEVKRDKEAQQLGERALKLERQHLGEQHWLTCDTMALLSTCYRKEGTRESRLHAIELLESLLKIHLTYHWWQESIRTARKIWRTWKYLGEVHQMKEAKRRHDELVMEHGRNDVSTTGHKARGEDAVSMKGHQSL